MIAAVVLTFDAAEGMLEACVESVLAGGDIDQLVVVDNGTKAGARLAAAGCTVVTTGSNLGYAGGVNVGLRWALDRGAAHIAVLNDDVMVEQGWLRPVLDEFAALPAVGAVQPKLLFDRSDPPTVNSVGVELGRDGAGRDIGHGEVDGPAFAETGDIQIFTGGAVVFAAPFLRDLGCFDERFFLYYEDVDLALRGAARGWRYRCVPASRVWHRGSATTEAAGHLATYLRERNRLWILIRHRPLGHVATGLWLSIRRLRWPPRAVHARALLTGLAAAPRLVFARLRAR